MKERSNDNRVKAIRADLRVGRGSCSSIDECWEDQELIEAMNEAHVETETEAVHWALQQQRAFLEEGLNQRWGDDDDPQLLEYEAFVKGDENDPEEPLKGEER